MHSPSPLVDGDGATVKKAFVFLGDFRFVPIGVVGFHKLKHPSFRKGAILGAEAGEVTAVEEAVEAGDDREKTHGRDLRQKPARAPARAPKRWVRKRARGPPPTNSR